LLGARKLKLTEVPVIVLDHLTETQKRAYILADNRLALSAGWDEELLQIELQALRDADFNLDFTGFDEEELTRLLESEGTEAGLTDEDAVPDVPETPTSQYGDLWLLGQHKLLVGDATKSSDVRRLMSGDAADVVVTDPPYNVDYEGYTDDKLKIQSDKMSPDQFQQFLAAAFRTIAAS
jgi:ParB-like chromosome segregation protein Spo0J